MAWVALIISENEERGCRAWWWPGLYLGQGKTSEEARRFPTKEMLQADLHTKEDWASARSVGWVINDSRFRIICMEEHEIPSYAIAIELGARL
jgi:hypothetical protein